MTITAVLETCKTHRFINSNRCERFTEAAVFDCELLLKFILKFKNHVTGVDKFGIIKVKEIITTIFIR